MVRTVDTIVALNRHPAIADRAVRAGRDRNRRIMRRRPGRIDDLFLDLVISRRGRRGRLPGTNRIKRHTVIPTEHRQRTRRQIDDNLRRFLLLLRCSLDIRLGQRLSARCCIKHLRRTIRLRSLYGQRHSRARQQSCPQEACKNLLFRVFHVSYLFSLDTTMTKTKLPDVLILQTCLAGTAVHGRE